MESIVRDKIVSHLMEHDIQSDDQHGFVPGRDCMSQLLICLDEWTELLEEGENFDVIFRDFAKVFDSVPHQRLFVKLESIGIKGNLLEWIKSFLKNRAHNVFELMGIYHLG